MTERVPGIIRDVQALNPDYSSEIQKALDRLHDEIVGNQPMQMLDLPAPDYALWADQLARYKGEGWLETVWFFAENYFYRRLIEAVRWWETGRDPFHPKKEHEYASDALWQLLGEALALDGSLEERLGTLLQFALWGNRMDLSYSTSQAHGSQAGDDDLLVDDTAAVVAHLMQKKGVVHVVADNAGTELAMDMALIDALLQDVAEKVVVHVKMYPAFVSDATTRDGLNFWERLESGRYGKAEQALGRRLRKSFNEGRLHLAPDLYWNTGYVLREMPSRLRETFRSVDVVILKGDANYRRALDDAVWQADTPFSEAVGYFPVSLVALRTLKSYPVVGLEKGAAAELDANDKGWRINGQRGLIQFFNPES
jgi:hypothetical protein